MIQHFMCVSSIALWCAHAYIRILYKFCISWVSCSRRSLRALSHSHWFVNLFHENECINSSHRKHHIRNLNVTDWANKNEMIIFNHHFASQANTYRLPISVYVAAQKIKISQDWCVRRAIISCQVFYRNRIKCEINDIYSV